MKVDKGKGGAQLVTDSAPAPFIHKRLPHSRVSDKWHVTLQFTSEQQTALLPFSFPECLVPELVYTGHFSSLLEELQKSSCIFFKKPQTVTLLLHYYSTAFKAMKAHLCKQVL